MSRFCRVRKLTFVGLSLVLLAVLGASTSDAADMPSKRYRDPNAKFSFRIFEDWAPVPVESKASGGFDFGTDKFMVARFAESGADKRGMESARIQAFRLGQGTQGQSSGETTPGTSDPFLERLKKELAKDDPQSMKALFDRTLGDYGFKGPLDAKAAKVVKSKDGIVGQIWTMESASERDPTRSYFHVFAAWKKGDMEIGLWMWSPPESKKRLEQGLVAVAKSFQFFDAKAEDVKSLEVLDGLPISPAKRREIERGLVRGWDVLVSPKKNYIIIYNTVGKRNDLLARIIAERIEKIRELVYETRFPPAKKIEAVSVVRICGDRAEYAAYGGPSGSAGYWNNGTEELVFYDASPAKEPDDDTLAVLYHEAFHQFIFYSVGEVSPHSWFNEGTGDYFSGSRYAAGKFTVRPFNWRLGTIQAAIRKGPCPYEESEGKDGDTHFKFERVSGGYTPLKAFVRLTQRDYYSYPGISYAQGWSFIYFLREGVPKNPKWNAKWGKILETYFDTLKREANRDKPIKPPSAPKDPGPAGGMGEPAPGSPPEGPGMSDAPVPPAPEGPGGGAPPAPDGKGPGGEDPGMGEPGQDPGMGEPGDPGMGEPGAGGPDDEGMGLPPAFLSMFSSERALKAAVEAAFKDVDFTELEEAWKAYTLKVH